MSNLEIFKRLYRDYTSKFLKNILLAVFFSIIVATSTSAIAWLLDPAIKKLFIEKDQKLIFIIPLAIIIAFASKGISLYFAKTILIGVSEVVELNEDNDPPSPHSDDLESKEITLQEKSPDLSD